jgi:antitoxin ParD1/3/4
VALLGKKRHERLGSYRCIPIGVHVVRSINLSLTDELRAFVDASSGDGTLFATPSEYIRGLIREKKERMDAAALREAILAGYDDVLHGRTKAFTGNLREMLEEHRRSQSKMP